MTRRTRWARMLVVGLGLTAAAVLVPTPSYAVPGLTTISATSANNSTTFRHASAVCPNGTVVLGGGADVIDGGTSVRLVGSSTQKNHWVADAIEDPLGYAGNWKLRAWAICGEEPDGYSIVYQAVDTDSNGGATATCPAGRKVIGAGGLATGQAPDDLVMVLDTIRPMPGGTSVKVEAFQLDPDDPHPSTVVAVAVCADPLWGLQLVSNKTPFASSSSEKSISVGCPPSTELHGMSASISGGMGQVYLDSVVAFSLGAVAAAREDPNGYRGSWTIEVFALCAY